MAEPISLDAYRARRDAASSTPAPATTAARLRYATLSATTAGQVRVVFGDGAEFELSPSNARTWAERLAAMADVAEGVRREDDAKGGPWHACLRAGALSCSRGCNHG